MNLRDFSNEIVKLVSEVSEGVVSIITTKISIDSFLRAIPVRGVGSGFIIDFNGHVITNNHVVAGVDETTIFLSSGEKVVGKVVNRDPSRDIAMLRIPKTDIKPLKLGDSDNVRIGEMVLAIGSPLGLPGPNVTIGVVSAVRRNIRGKNIFLEDLIQTDAAINPGNSGGPLINMDGEVIGVTTAMIPYAQGISFAIPINAVKTFIEMLSKYGRTIRPWIGVYVIDNSPSIANYYNLPINYGVIIVDIHPNSPAEDAGLYRGDIIINANDEPIKNTSELRRKIYESIEQRYIKLKIVRKTDIHEISVPILIEY